MTRSILLIVWICFAISIGNQRAILTISCLKQLNGIEHISIIFAIWFNRLAAKNLPVDRFGASASDGRPVHRQAKSNHRQANSKEWRNP
jgi:hypothetical protein